MRETADELSQVTPNVALSEWHEAAEIEAQAHEVQRAKAAVYLRQTHPDLLDLAVDIWQNEADAIEWFVCPHGELGLSAPIAYLESSDGEKRVQYILGALEHGFPV